MLKCSQFSRLVAVLLMRRILSSGPTMTAIAKWMFGPYPSWSLFLHIVPGRFFVKAFDGSPFMILLFLFSSFSWLAHVTVSVLHRSFVRSFVLRVSVSLSFPCLVLQYVLVTTKHS